ncbi:hypothetical protein BDP27DRAFT_747058 [Rhodocollybia butyracea]|uniref:Mediator of RNA polymerase II transcription subunit 5 n=1 Tax=Rhodocollybia butyracea TaxID=206335 RepID=A0A9P5PW25_9AGAR|nr:hypothetical protein BDP27DRAFT_747058 [Rhodocollybia butyracea]
MTIPEITRNCFQCGISASKWASLCKLFLSKLSKDTSDHSREAVGNSISNSVLILYRSYPGDPALFEYLKYALRDGMISLAIFVSTFLEAARSPQLHHAATLDMLCRTALDFSSGQPPVGSIVAFDESPIVVLGVVQDALGLLEIAYSLPGSHFHQLTASSSELVILLLSCISDMSQVSTAQAGVHFQTANGLLQNYRLSSDVRAVLETFVLTLSLLMGDDAKLAREAQMMHTMQLTLGKGDIVGSSSSTDLVTLSLTFNSLISLRAGDFGAGNLQYCAAVLVGIFRWTSWSPTVFYTQVILSALVCLSQSSTITTMIWKSFVIGRLPQILVAFEKCVNADNANAETDWKHAMQNALFAVLRRNDDLLSLCDNTIARVEGSSGHSSAHPVSRLLLKEFLFLGLLEQRLAVTIDPGIVNDNTSTLRSEAQDVGITLEAYLDSKLSGEGDEPRMWLSRIRREPGCHAAFAECVKQRFVSATSQLDVEAMSHICRLLYHEQTLDALSLHISVSELIAYALHFFEIYTCETVGDPQTALSHLGHVVFFSQAILARFNLQSNTFSVDGKTMSSEFLKTTAEVYSHTSLSGGDLTTFNAWLKALCDGEGIEDTILRSTQPKTLLRIAASLVLHAIGLTVEGKMSMDELRTGVVGYFTNPLLNWTLVGIIKALLHDINHKRFNAPIHLEVLQTLLLAPSCPRLVLALCGPRVMAFLANRARKGGVASAGLNNEELQRVLTAALGAHEEARIRSAIATGPRVPLQEYPKQAIQTALNAARTTKVPSIDVERCLKVISPSKFLQVLWSELLVAASVPTEIENSRRLAVFILTALRPPTTPPLLPIFLHNILPSLIIHIDSQQPGPEQTMSAELLVALVSSVLTAHMHLELAMRSVSVKPQAVLGQTSSAMARRLVSDLRTRGKFSYTSTTLAQRLSSSQSFVTNFPVFMEVGI